IRAVECRLFRRDQSPSSLAGMNYEGCFGKGDRRNTRPSGLRALEISIALDGMAGFHLCAGQIGSVCPALQNRMPIVIGLEPSAADIPRGNQAAKMIAAGNRIAGCAATTRPTGTRHFRSV